MPPKWRQDGFSERYYYGKRENPGEERSSLQEQHLQFKQANPVLKPAGACRSLAVLMDSGSEGLWFYIVTSSWRGCWGAQTVGCTANVREMKRARGVGLCSIVFWALWHPCLSQNFITVNLWAFFPSGSKNLKPLKFIDYLHGLRQMTSLSYRWKIQTVLTKLGHQESSNAECWKHRVWPVHTLRSISAALWPVVVAGATRETHLCHTFAYRAVSAGKGLQADSM